MSKRAKNFAISAAFPFLAVAMLMASRAAVAGCGGETNEAMAEALMWTLTGVGIAFAATGVLAPIGFGFGVAAFGLYTLDLIITHTIC